MQMKSCAVVAALAVALVPSTAPAADNGPKSPPLSAWLQTVYGNHARWNSDWIGQATVNKQRVAGVTHSLCGDSGPQPDGTRYLVVCLAGDGDGGHAASGSADLFVVRGSGAAAQTIASLRDVGSAMGWGNSDDVAFVDVGPGRKAFLLSGGYTSTGVTESTDSLYLFDGGSGLRSLSWSSGYSNGDRCGDDTGRCATTATETTCKISADRSKVSNGWYALSVRVRGTRKGRVVAKDVPIALREGWPVAPAAKSLTKLGCAFAD